MYTMLIFGLKWFGKEFNDHKPVNVPTACMYIYTNFRTSHKQKPLQNANWKPFFHIKQTSR